MHRNNIFYGTTFGDFIFRPQKGILESRKFADLSMQLVDGIRLKLPIVSANMDTVTGAKMAKAMALNGGIGFIHRAQPIEAQAKMVGDVKKQHSFVIEDPLTVHVYDSVGYAKELTRRNSISGLLVTEGVRGQQQILAGILSKRDMASPLANDTDLVRVHMTSYGQGAYGHGKLFTTSDPTITMERAEEIMLKNKIEKLPVIDSNRKILGLITLKDIREAKQKPNSSKDGRGRLLVGATIGATGDYLERAGELIKAGVDVILVDIAHGHSDVMEKAVEKFKNRFPGTELICGNVGTDKGALFLSELGVGGIKVGIGPGKGCRTRIETGAGVPQLQAIREAYLVVHERGCSLIADGGAKNDSDIALAILCGASTVMLGNILAGTDETPGELITDPATGQKTKYYRGMTSPQAVLDSTEEDFGEALSTPAEGQQGRVLYKGKVDDVLARIRGHLQSAVSYLGVSSLGAAREMVCENPKDYLVRLTESAKKESFER